MRSTDLTQDNPKILEDDKPSRTVETFHYHEESNHQLVEGHPRT